jgi:peptidoglycan/xylan/chitin deacetylase (PgdA/CDA1 family)
VTGWMKRSIRSGFPALLSGAPILLYHRVTEQVSDPWALCVSPSHFAEHLSVLRRHSRPIPLQRLAGDTGPLPGSAVAITFDDGYADNLHAAKPLLERYEVPATFFVSSGLLDEDAEFWWDDLERILLQPGRLPALLQVQVAGTRHVWDLGAAASYTIEQARSTSTWKAWHDAPTMRHQLYVQLYEVLSSATPEDRASILRTLRAWSSIERAARPTHRTLRAEEVQALDQSELIEIGAHTVTHPTLATLTPEEQACEIKRSRARLEQIVQHPLRGFSYPFGRKRDYNAESVALVKAAGFGYACSNFGGLVAASTDRYELPRMQVQNWDGEQFAGQLRGWFGW